MLATVLQAAWFTKSFFSPLSLFFLKVDLVVPRAAWMRILDFVLRSGMRILVFALRRNAVQLVL